MISKSEIKAGDVFKHKNIGIMYVDEECIALNKLLGTDDSVFVYNGDGAYEVSLSLLSRLPAE